MIHKRGRCGGDRHPGGSSLPGSVGFGRAHSLTKTGAMRPPHRTSSSYGPHSSLGRWFTSTDHMIIPRVYQGYRRGYMTNTDLNNNDYD